MKTQKLSPRSQAGTVLLVTVVTAAVIGVVLLSFLELIHARTKVRARSNSWNQAIPVLDSGIEEALTHIQDDGTNLTANNWVQSGTGQSTIYRKGGTNSDGSFFIVTISNATSFPLTAPVIYSQGFVLAPLKEGYISRLVQVTLARGTNFSKAVVAKGKIDLSGQSIVDSFDSSDTNYSSNGNYDPAKRKSNGSVLTNYRGTPAIDVGNGHIYGTASTGPGGTIDFNGGGSVGDAVWAASHSGVESGFSSDDANIAIPDPTLPPGYSSWPVLAKATGQAQFVGGTNYDYVVSGNVTATGGLSLKNGLAVVGDATLYIAGDFGINGGGWIYITPGSSLKVYVSGNTTINGGGVVNGTGQAVNFSYYGLSSNTQIKYAGNADFIGTVNAPEADFTMSGGASLNGAAIVNTYTSKSSNSGLHYDEHAVSFGMLKLTGYREL